MDEIKLEYFDGKEWKSLESGMVCFPEIPPPKIENIGEPECRRISIGEE